MNNRLIVVSLFLFINFMLAYSQDYYWNKGEKISVKKSDGKNYYLFSNADKAIQGLEINSAKVYDRTLYWALGDFKDDNLIEYASPAVINLMGDTLNFSNLFYVKLKDEKNIEQLERMAKENNVEILGNNKFMPRWYTLSCSKKSTGNALEMANLFHESNLFSVAEADFLIHYKPTSCVSDTYFNNQWNLNNTGQYGGTPGIDINYCSSRSITTGNPNIIVAVIDHGIQMNHPDITNLHPSSYNAMTGTSPSQVLGSHGTPCAGIIGANSNNGIGISGIAPNSRLMSVSHNLFVTPNAPQQLANGINWAWQNGASVISNSWGHNLLNSYHNSYLIDNAISNALQLGRGGRGTVVVFSAGNNNSAVIYPANSNPDIIVVGAMSPCGERKNFNSCDRENIWGSNYGATLDIMAPGVLVSTTDLTGVAGYNPGTPIHTNSGGNIITSDYADRDYTVWFNGTSAAAPHVAGVAALILSVNPNLTQRQVANIIESTARKVGGYNYQITTGRPNGTWNNEMGYGLVDAYAAIRRTICTMPSVGIVGTLGVDMTLYGSSVGMSDFNVLPGYRFRAIGCNNVNIAGPFSVPSGAMFEARTAP
jgi:subtilisin family serine protease